MKVCAAKAGMDLADYKARVDAGEKRCYLCQQWKNAEKGFAIDRSRHDGRSPRCFECKRVKEPKSHKGRVSTFKGHTHTEEAKRKQSEAKLGKPAPHKRGPRPPEFGAKISAILRASPNVPRGEAVKTFKDGKTAERRGVRFSAEYKRWRYDVFSRDAFTCQHCGDGKGGNLNAHHIKPFSDFPDLRFDISNGITLCEICHNKVHDKPDSTRKRARAKRAARQAV